jgi:hypothetical protein
MSAGVLEDLNCMESAGFLAGIVWAELARMMSYLKFMMLLSAPKFGLHFLVYNKKKLSLDAMHVQKEDLETA